jgi:hypothetical protein
VLHLVRVVILVVSLLLFVAVCLASAWSRDCETPGGVPSLERSSFSEDMSETAACLPLSCDLKDIGEWALSAT